MKSEKAERVLACRSQFLAACLLSISRGLELRNRESVGAWSLVGLLVFSQEVSERRMLRTLLVRTLVTGALIGVVISATSAATRTWSGGGIDANWATPLNWVGGVAPSAGDALVFDGFGRLTNNNNLALDSNI